MAGGRNYFLIVSVLALILTLVGFSDNLLTDIGQRSNSDPKFIVHGLFSLAWMILLVMQTGLVRMRNVNLHRRLGIAGMVIAAGVTLSTIFVFWAVWKDWSLMSAEVKANRMLLPSYAAFVIAGYVQRRRADWHKRLILVATFFMLGPVLARAFDPLFLRFVDHLAEPKIDALFWVYFFTVWHAFFLSLIVRDQLVDGRVHRVSAGGYGLFCLIWGIATLT